MRVMRHPFQFLLILTVLTTVGACSSSSDSGSSEATAGVDAADSSSADGNSSTPSSSGTQPTVSLSASDIQVDVGDTVTLSWSSTNADACDASGGWSGAKPTSGSEQVGPLQNTQTFSLSCSGAGGSAVQMISVTVIGSLQITWQPPTENVDGTPVTSLSSFRIHVGERSRSYDEVVEVDGAATVHTMRLPTGPYYIAMTAINPDNEESALSNEVRLSSR